MNLQVVPDSDRLEFQLLGGFTVTANGRPVVRWPNNRVRGLAQFLALAAGPVRRDLLLDTFWPDLPVARARNNLNVTMTRLRRTLGLAGPHGIVQTQGLVSWCPTIEADSDVTTFDRHVVAARRADLVVGDRIAAVAEYWHAIHAYGGVLLPEDPYSDWLTPTRDRLERAYLDVLTRVAELLEESGQLPGAIWASELTLRSDPFDDSAMARRARCLAVGGQARRALHELDRYQDRLRSCIGAPPTRALLEARGELLTLLGLRPSQADPAPLALASV